MTKGAVMTDAVVEKFRPTSGRLMGSVGIVIALVVAGIGVLDPDQDIPAYVVFVALFVGVLIWAAMLRPQLWATESDLVFRNMLSTVSVPLAAIEQVVVRQVLAVRAGDQRFVSPAIGNSLRQELRHKGEPDPTAAESYPVFVEERIRHLATDARERAGISHLSDEQLALAADVRRVWAWPEVAALALIATGFLVALLA